MNQSTPFKLSMDVLDERLDSVTKFLRRLDSRIERFRERYHHSRDDDDDEYIECEDDYDGEDIRMADDADGGVDANDWNCDDRDETMVDMSRSSSTEDDGEKVKERGGHFDVTCRDDDEENIAIVSPPSAVESSGYFSSDASSGSIGAETPEGHAPGTRRRRPSWKVDVPDEEMRDCQAGQWHRHRRPHQQHAPRHRSKQHPEQQQQQQQQQHQHHQAPVSMGDTSVNSSTMSSTEICRVLWKEGEEEATTSHCDDGDECESSSFHCTEDISFESPPCRKTVAFNCPRMNEPMSVPSYLAYWRNCQCQFASVVGVTTIADAVSKSPITYPTNLISRTIQISHFPTKELHPIQTLAVASMAKRFEEEGNVKLASAHNQLIYNLNKRHMDEITRVKCELRTSRQEEIDRLCLEMKTSLEMAALEEMRYELLSSSGAAEIARVRSEANKEHLNEIERLRTEMQASSALALEGQARELSLSHAVALKELRAELQAPYSSELVRVESEANRQYSDGKSEANRQYSDGIGSVHELSDESVVSHNETLSEECEDSYYNGEIYPENEMDSQVDEDSFYIGHDEGFLAFDSVDESDLSETASETDDDNDNDTKSLFDSYIIDTSVVLGEVDERECVHTVEESYGQLSQCENEQLIQLRSELQSSLAEIERIQKEMERLKSNHAEELHQVAAAHRQDFERMRYAVEVEASLATELKKVDRLKDELRSIKALNSALMVQQVILQSDYAAGRSFKHENVTHSEAHVLALTCFFFLFSYLSNQPTIYNETMLGKPSVGCLDEEK